MSTSITDGQKKQYLRFVEDAAERALKVVNPGKDGLQKFFEKGDDFQARIVAAVRDLSVSRQFADEEVGSGYGYPSGYEPKGIAEQIATLKSFFPELGTAGEVMAGGALPPNAEGWFAIPRWENIAPTYGEAVQKVLDLVKQTRNGAFYNHREGQLGPQYLRQSQKSSKAFQKLGDEQKDRDILIVPGQFGLRHRGRSVRRACEAMNTGEFGHGSFAIGIMLLTHPERLMNYNDLWIDCAGDEFAPDADGDFSESPYFYFLDDEVRFGTGWFSDADDRCGSASGFLSQ